MVSVVTFNNASDKRAIGLSGDRLSDQQANVLSDYQTIIYIAYMYLTTV